MSRYSWAPLLITSLFVTAATAQQATVSLTPDSTCYPTGGTVTVTIDLSDVTGVDEVTGGQFLLNFDSTVLSLDTVSAADTVWTELIESQVNGESINVLVGVPPDPPGQGALSGTMAIITFTADTPVCNVADLVQFRADEPPLRNRLSAMLAGDPVNIQTVNLTQNDLGPIFIGESDPPTLTGTISDAYAGHLNASCQSIVNVDLTVADTCCLTSDGLDITYTITNGTYDDSTLSTTLDGNTISIVGTILVTHDAGCDVTFAIDVDALDCCGNAATTFSWSATLSDTTAPAIVIEDTLLDPLIDDFDADTSTLWEHRTGPWDCDTGEPGTWIFGTPTYNTGFISAPVPASTCPTADVFNYLRTTRALDTGNAYDGALLGDLTGRTLRLQARLYKPDLPAGQQFQAADFLLDLGDNPMWNPGFSIYIKGSGDVVEDDYWFYTGAPAGIDAYLDATQLRNNEWSSLVVDFSDATRWTNINGDSASDPTWNTKWTNVVADVDELRMGATGGSSVATVLAFATGDAGILDIDFITTDTPTISASADAGLCSAELSLPLATATDACETPIDVVYSIDGTPLSDPYAFEVGTTVLEITAADSCGNTRLVEIPVTVTDDEAPQLDSFTVTGGPLDNSCAGTVTIDAIVADNCCIPHDDVIIDARLAAGTADLGTPVVNKTGSDTVTIDGEIPVTNLADCSADVEVTLFARDCYGHAIGSAGPAPINGRWTESYGPGGPPDGSAVHAASWDGNTLATEWELASVIRTAQPELIEDTYSGDPNGNGEIVWRTPYAGGTLWLAASLWGGNDVTAEVVQHIHYTHHVYVNGELDLQLTWNETVTYAALPAEDLGIILIGIARLDGNGATPPADYPAPEPGYESTAQWGRIESLTATLVSSQTVTVADLTPPAISDCPTAIEVPATAGLCEALVEWTAPTVIDNCDTDPIVEYLIDVDNDAVIDATITNTSYNFPVGTHAVTVSTVDACNNTDDTSCTFPITVLDKNALIVDVQLDGAWSGETFARCLKFWLVDCDGASTSVEQQVTFTNGLAASVPVLVDCDIYECVMVDDELHSLRRRLDDGAGFSIVDGAYVADFTGPSQLIQGDLFNDLGEETQDVIDILDFGVYITRWGHAYSDPDCETPFPHADLNGDGVVDVADFSFIQANILEIGDLPCCASLSPLTDLVEPVTSITVDELIARGLANLVPADLNEDGVLDFADLEAFLNGELPDNGPQPGDLNCDGTIDLDDISPFVDAIVNPDVYAIEYPDCDAHLADVNRDGSADFNDINAFVSLLTGF